MGVTLDQRQAVVGRHLLELLERSSVDIPFSRDDLVAMHRLAVSDKPALDRTCYEPGHFTASAFVLSPNRQNLLLIFHKKLRMWLQPGGHVEAEDRDLVAAAHREVQEETGLRELLVEETFFDLDVHRIPAFGETPAHLHHDVRCLFSAAEVEVRAGDEVSAARWFPLREICQSSGDLAGGFGTDRSVRRVAQRLFEMPCK